ncbi:MAG TPA: UDP binding domain-containing protein, partial [Polyangiaceae bacterium]|nr:UDP binding domain-containing protein [Polyangiaceae bacterium]
NTKVVDIVHELQQFGIEPIIHDPLVEAEGHSAEAPLRMQPWSEFTGLDALILAVPHRQILQLPRQELFGAVRENGLFMDLKGAIPPSEVRPDLKYWSL